MRSLPKKPRYLRRSARPPSLESLWADLHQTNAPIVREYLSLRIRQGHQLPLVFCWHEAQDATTIPPRGVNHLVRSFELHRLAVLAIRDATCGIELSGSLDGMKLHDWQAAVASLISGR